MLKVDDKIDVKKEDNQKMKPFQKRRFNLPQTVRSYKTKRQEKTLWVTVKTSQRCSEILFRVEEKMREIQKYQARNLGKNHIIFQKNQNNRGHSLKRDPPVTTGTEIPAIIMFGNADRASSITNPTTMTRAARAPS